MTAESPLFEQFIDCRLSPGKETPRISYTFDPSPVADHVLMFCFPDLEALVGGFPGGDFRDGFVFTLTGSDGRRQYGYVSRLVCSGELCCHVFISHHAWFILFDQFLSITAGVLAREGGAQAPGGGGGGGSAPVPQYQQFVRFLSLLPLPAPGRAFDAFDLRELPPLARSALGGLRFLRPPEDAGVCLDPPAIARFLFGRRALSPSSLLLLLSCLLVERRVIVHARTPSSAATAVHALGALLYPFEWQHVLIPVLPRKLMPYVEAPMPYLMGVQTALMREVRGLELERDVVIVDLDRGAIEDAQKIRDGRLLPREELTRLKDALERAAAEARLAEAASARSRAVAEVRRACLQLFLNIFGSYRGFFRRVAEARVRFDFAAFLAAAPRAHRGFLRSFAQTQMFAQWVLEREQWAAGGAISPCYFEEQVTLRRRFAGKSTPPAAAAASLPGGKVKKKKTAAPASAAAEAASAPTLSGEMQKRKPLPALPPKVTGPQRKSSIGRRSQFPRKHKHKLDVQSIDDFYKLHEMLAPPGCEEMARQTIFMQFRHQHPSANEKEEEIGKGEVEQENEQEEEGVQYFDDDDDDDDDDDADGGKKKDDISSFKNEYNLDDDDDLIVFHSSGDGDEDDEDDEEEEIIEAGVKSSNKYFFKEDNDLKIINFTIHGGSSTSTPTGISGGGGSIGGCTGSAGGKKMGLNDIEVCSTGKLQSDASAFKPLSFSEDDVFSDFQ